MFKQIGFPITLVDILMFHPQAKERESTKDKKSEIKQQRGSRQSKDSDGRDRGTVGVKTIERKKSFETDEAQNEIQSKRKTQSTSTNSKKKRRSGSER